MKQKKNSKESHLSSASAKSVSKTSSSLPSTDIFKIFAEVQWAEAFHDKYTRQLTKVYENTPFKIFVDDFICCLKKVFISNDKNLEKNVELTLDFAARFIVSLIDLESEETDPFLMSILDFLFENHDCHDTAVRLHCCLFINSLLKSLGPNASLDVNVCESISMAMLERLQDKAATVRTQAVFALHRLQDPSIEHCKIIEVFLYHMTRDPSAEVRCAIINNVVIIQRTLTTILSRINDCKDEVRRDAYIVCSKVSVQKFRIKQRQMMLNSGFLDPSEKVKDFVKNKLLPKWLSTYKNDYANFLRALNIQSEVGLEVGIKSLKVIFSHEEKCNLIDYLLNRMKQKTIPYDCLNPEIVLFWRILAEYLQPPRDSEAPDELFEKIMPDLTYFSDYIKGFFTSYNYSGSSASSDDDAKSIEKEFILILLLEMTKCYDLADEFGRRNFSDLCISLLKDPQVTIKSVPIIVNRLSWAMPDVTERITAVVELISDLREPFFDGDATANSSFGDLRSIEATKTQLLERLKVLENERLEASQTEDMMIAREVEKEIASIEKKLADLQRKSTDIPSSQSDENIDPVVATKVLKIINEMIDSRDVTRLTPALRSLFDNVVLPSFKRNMQNATVSCLSLETFGMFCSLDPVLAKERFIVFCFLISNNLLTVPAVKAVFDLLQKYGLKMFSLKDEDNDVVKEERDKRRSGNTSNTSDDSGNQSGKYLIPLLYSLLDSDSSEVRNVATLGLCKLLLVGHLRSSTLVAKLIALWFNPTSSEDPSLVQMLSLFFKSFVKTRGAQYILERAFLPTLQIFFDASPEDPLSEIEIDNVVRLLINLTDAEFGTSLPKGYRVHNQLANVICDELLQNTRNSRERSTALVKALLLLSIDSEDTDFISKLLDKTDTLIHKYKSTGEKNCQRYAVKFSVMLSVLKKEVETKLGESEVCNTLSTTMVSEKKCDSLSATTSKDAVTNSENMDSNMEIEDSVKQQNETVIEASIVEDSDKEISDSESVVSSVSNYGMRRKKNDTEEDGIVIPSSDEDETESKKLDDVFIKCNSRCSSMSLTSQEEIGFQKVIESATKRSLRSGSSHSSQSSQNSFTAKGKKRVTRLSSSTSSQSSQFDSPRTTSSEASIASPADSISSRTRYNTRSARKLKK